MRKRTLKVNGDTIFKIKFEVLGEYLEAEKTFSIYYDKGKLVIYSLDNPMIRINLSEVKENGN